MVIYALNISKLQNKTYLSFFGKYVTKDLKNIKLINRAISTVLGEILIKYILSFRYGMQWDEIYFEMNEYGKPILKNNKNLYFNISHSKDWVVCVLDDEEVGIDIEKITECKIGIAKRFFCDEEYSFIMSKDYNEYNDAFVEIWTLKESYLKAIGTGLCKSLNSFCVVEKNKIKLISSNYSFKQFSDIKDYKLTVCSLRKSKSFPKEINYIDVNKIISFLNRKVYY